MHLLLYWYNNTVKRCFSIRLIHCRVPFCEEGKWERIVECGQMKTIANKSDKSLVSVCKIWTVIIISVRCRIGLSMNEYRKKREREKKYHFIDGIGTHQYFMIISHHNRYNTSQSTETPINLIRKKVIIIIIIFSNYCSSIKHLCLDIYI